MTFMVRIIANLYKNECKSLWCSLKSWKWVCMCVSVLCENFKASRVFVSWQWFTTKSLQSCAATKRLTACQCRMIQIPLHYKCKDEFKNIQDWIIQRLPSHSQMFFDLMLDDLNNVETIRIIRFGLQQRQSYSKWIKGAKVC